MDLKNGSITVNEILNYPGARALLHQEFPQLAGSPLLGLAGGMTYRQLMSMAKNALPPQQLDRLVKKIQEL